MVSASSSIRRDRCMSITLSHWRIPLQTHTKNPWTTFPLRTQMPLSFWSVSHGVAKIAIVLAQRGRGNVVEMWWHASMASMVPLHATLETARVQDFETASSAIKGFPNRGLLLSHSCRCFLAHPNLFTSFCIDAHVRMLLFDIYIYILISYELSYWYRTCLRLVRDLSKTGTRQIGDRLVAVWHVDRHPDATRQHAEFQTNSNMLI